MSTTNTCGNCGHRVAMHGVATLYHRNPHRCDLTGSWRIHPSMGACDRWAPRPAARIRIEPKHATSSRKDGGQ
jgi:hypothetical protein